VTTSMTTGEGTVMEDSGAFVNGRRAATIASARRTLVNPATGAPHASVPDCGVQDVERAVDAARDALAGSAWRSTTPTVRADLVSALGTALGKRAEEFAHLVTTENGSPIARTRAAQGTRVPQIYSYFAGLGRDFEAEELRHGSGTLVRRLPVGVAGLITPWNGPQSLLAFKLAPALIAGCTVVVKPALETSLDALLLADCATNAGFPPGVINVVTGGAETGEALVRSPSVDMIAFTGSPTVGRSIGAFCGGQLRPAVLELGGKSAAIVMEDADLGDFGRQVTSVCMPNTGQVCYSCTRILAPRSRYEEVLDAVVAAVRESPVGDPMDPAVVFGPLVSAQQRDRVESLIECGRKEGAKVVLGGSTKRNPSPGFFVSPTVFRDVDNRMRIAQEEIFGPVLTLIPYDDDEDAVRLANDTPFGLGGVVFGRSVDRARRIARQVHAGTFGINGYKVSLDSPFGGTKGSGIGRELGPEGLSAYTQPQSIYGYQESKPLGKTV